MNRAAMLKSGFLLILLLLCAGMFWGVLRLALPRSEWVEIGRLADFPPAEQPYEVFSPVYVFVINDGDQLQVLDPRNQASRGVNVRWIPDEKAFIDPNRGSSFNLVGLPIRRLGSNQPIENQSLPRYVKNIENGMVYIDLTRKNIVAISGNQEP